MWIVARPGADRIVLMGCLLALAALKIDPLRERGTWATLAWFGAIVEAVAGVMLMTKAWRYGAVVAVAMGGIGLLIVAGLRMFGMHPASCGCFGRADVPEWLHVLICVGLVALGGSVLGGARALPTRASTHGPDLVPK